VGRIGPFPPAGSGPRGMFPDLDAAYARLLEAQARLRRAVAVVATSRRNLELRAGQIEREAAEGDVGSSSERAEVRRQLDAVRAEERRVAEAGQRLQEKVSALHDAKVAVEAASAAADETAATVLAEVDGS
jgi:phage shock protein A